MILDSTLEVALLGEYVLIMGYVLTIVIITSQERHASPKLRIVWWSTILSLPSPNTTHFLGGLFLHHIGELIAERLHVAEAASITQNTHPGIIWAPAACIMVGTT